MMSADNLNEAIKTAWNQTQRTAPGADLDKAKEHLDKLRNIQIAWADWTTREYPNVMEEDL